MHRKHIALSFALILSSLFIQAQKKYTLSGTISEASSNETMIGVTVAFPDLKTGVTTNEYGFYSITLPEGEYEITVSYLGFQDIRETVTLNTNIKKDFSLSEEARTVGRSRGHG